MPRCCALSQAGSASWRVSNLKSQILHSLRLRLRLPAELVVPEPFSRPVKPFLVGVAVEPVVDAIKGPKPGTRLGAIEVSSFGESKSDNDDNQTYQPGRYESDRP